MEHEVKALQETETVFNELKTNPKSVLLSIDELEKNLPKKLIKSPYTKYKQLNLLENNMKKRYDDKVPIRLDYVENGKLKDICFTVSMVLFSSRMPTSPM